MEAQQYFTRHMNCSVCLQNRTPSRAQVFVVVGEAEGDPAVIGFCYAHAASMSDSFKAMARGTPPKKSELSSREPAYRSPAPAPRA
jgi:hypothetical protein